jgi:hypothetical protein
MTHDGQKLWRFHDSTANGIARRAPLGHTPAAMRPPAFALLFCLLLPACGNLQNLSLKVRAKQRERELKNLTEASVSEASSRLGEKAVGEVILVNADSGFVLLRARNGITLDAGQELLCQSSGAARLKVTPERKSNMFFAADIVSGVPLKGDSVIEVKGSGKPAPKLVPVVARSLPGTTAPDNTLNLDPNSIRPEDLPRSTLDEPGSAPPSFAPVPSPANDPGNLLAEPPLPGDLDPPRQ